MLLLIFLWANQVIKNVLNVTVSGVVASCYFRGAHNPDRQALHHSLKRACTSSLGSICLGSLLVAFIQWSQAIVFFTSKRARCHRVLQRCMLCCLGCLDRLATFINSYAYAHIAIYGKPFMQAAKDSFKLMQQSGMHMVAQSDLVATVMLCACLVSAVLSGSLGTLWAQAALTGHSWMPVGLLAALVGFCFVRVVSGSMEAAVATLYVCYAEDPAQMPSFSPQAHLALQSQLKQQAEKSKAALQSTRK